METTLQTQLLGEPQASSCRCDAGGGPLELNHFEWSRGEEKSLRNWQLLIGRG